MDVNANIDIGNNLTQLIEKLGQQIGVAGKEIFPWYVQQAYIEGLTGLALTFGILLVFIRLFLYGITRLRAIDNPNPLDVGIIFSGSILALCLMIGAIMLPENVAKVFNPNYYAVNAMTRDIARLAGK